jgi:hypothetical protein
VLITLAFGLVIGTRRMGQTRRTGKHICSRADKFCTMRNAHLLGHIANIVALIGIGQEGHVNPILLKVAQPGRQPQDVHLPPSIIDVILAGDVPSSKSQEIRQRSPVSGTTSMPNMQRSGRVG